MPRPVRNAEVIAQRSGDSMVLFNMESGKYFSLNECGQRVWEACDGTRSETEIANLLIAEYDVPSHVADDVQALLNQLSAKGLLNPESL